MAPIRIKICKKEGTLSLEYSNGDHFILTGEYLRVHSPSAEVRGHGEGQKILQHGKELIKICNAEPAGNYALKLTFSDSHDSGIYTWGYLYDLASNHAKYWQVYLAALHDAGKGREPNVRIVQLMQPK
jgi:DUF971 family protein